MRINQLDSICKDTFAKISELSQKKNAEYANILDVFSNFEKASAGLSFHSKKEMVAWEYLTKHLQSIKDIISSDKTVSKEVIDEKFNDAITYLVLIKAMCYEKGKYKACETESTTGQIEKLKYYFIEQ